MTEFKVAPSSKGPPPSVYAALFLLLPAVVALALSILLPSLSQARELSRRTICGQNLAAYGRQMLMPSPGQVEHSSGASAKGCSNAKAWNYVVIDRSDKPLDPSAIIAYEPLENHGEGGNVMYADGHVDWLTREGYEKLIEPLQASTTASKVAQ